MGRGMAAIKGHARKIYEADSGSILAVRLKPSPMIGLSCGIHSGHIRQPQFGGNHRHGAGGTAGKRPHAFPEQAKGKVRIELRKKDSECELLVTDDGVGFPPDYDESAAPTLGLKLVAALIANVGGSLARSGGSGTSYPSVFK